MKIFIVGGAGYIGSHTVKMAEKKGHNVITIDNLSTGHKDAVLAGKFELCDLLDKDKLNQLFFKYKPDAVVHMGAFSIVSESVKNPYEYYQNNVSGSLNLFKAMIDNNCTKIIFSSSASIFGEPEYLPIDELHVKKPINPYGKTKLMVEEILKDFDKAYGLKYITFRYFNAAGHDPDGSLQERHNPETHLLPIIFQVINSQRGYVSIFGTDYLTSDGTCIRDYIHVNDIAIAHIKGLEYLHDNPKSLELNLGSGKGYSVKEIIQTVKKITKSNFDVREEPRRNGDPDTLISSGKKSMDILKFSPNYSDIESIIKTLIKDKLP